jgi:hypothetical protein
MKRINSLFYTIVGLLVFVLSSCGSLRVERVENYSKIISNLKTLVILQPDFYVYTYNNDSRSSDFVKSNRSKKIEKNLNLGFKRAARRFGISVEMPYLVTDYNAEYFNNLKLIEKQIIHTTELNSFLDNGKLVNNQVKIEPLSGNLMITPELIALQKKYQTPYFYQSIFIQKDGAILMISNLADVSIGKIIHREIRLVYLKPKRENLNRIIFNNFDQLINP